MAGAHLEPPLARDRHGQQQRVARLALELDAPARRRARTRHSPPPARATVRANGGASVTAVRRPHRDRGRRDAVHPPARERDAAPQLRLAPPPVLGEHRAPVLLRVRARAVQRARAEAAVTRAASSHGAQYWPSNGTICAGPSGPNGRRGHSRRCSNRTVQAGPRSTSQRLPVGAQRPGVDAEAVADAHGRHDLRPHPAGSVAER